MNDIRDFFISYNKADKEWAKWVAGILEEANYTTYIQAWDFIPGQNFVLEMQNAICHSKHTIIILSRDYLSSTYCQPEWAAAFNIDPESKYRKLIPIRISDVIPTGLLSSIIYIDIFGLNEDRAKTEILMGVSFNLNPRKMAEFPQKQMNYVDEKFDEIILFSMLFNADSISSIPFEEYWRQNYNKCILSVPIGKDVNGENVMLSIGSSKDGNNGFILGNSGVGKSVLMTTLMLSLAVHNHPRNIDFMHTGYNSINLPHKCKEYRFNFDDLLVDLKMEIEKREEMFQVHNVLCVESFNDLFPQKTMSHTIVIIDEISTMKYGEENALSRALSLLARARKTGFHFIFISTYLDDDIIKFAHYVFVFATYDDKIRLILDQSDITYRYRFGEAIFKSTKSGAYSKLKVAYSGSYGNTIEKSQLSQLENKMLYVYKKEVDFSLENGNNL